MKSKSSCRPVRERELYLRKRLAAKAKQAVSEEMLDRLAAQTQGMSIAHLERVLAHAAMMALTNAGVLTMPFLGRPSRKSPWEKPRPVRIRFVRLDMRPVTLS